MQTEQRYSPDVIYDEIAEYYDDIAQSVKYDATHLYNLSRPYINILLHNKMLDLGCGTGLASEPFANHDLSIFNILIQNLIEKK